MSSGRNDDEGGGQSLLDTFEEWYHVPVLAVVVAVMFWIRMRPYDRFIRNGDVLFSGNDPWYHLRAVQYTVRHWPFTIPFDPWTNFPFGTSVGQFGTLYDQIVATAALILGLGSPSSTLVAKVLLVAPPVFGALAAIPTYWVGKRIGNRLGGLFGAVLLMLLPGTYLTRTVVGAADHNAVEPFFQATAVGALLVGLAVVDREKPVWELVATRDWDALRPSLKWAALAGLAVSAYLSVWPPGVLLLGVLGVFAVLKISSDVYAEQSPEPVAFLLAVSMGVTAVVMVFQMDMVGFSAVQFSLLQPLFAVLVGGGAVFLAYLARVWDARNVPVEYYPWTTLALFVASLGVVAVVLPSLFGQISDNFYRVLGFSTEAATRTISEAQPFLSESIRQGLSPTEQILSEYGFTLFTGIIGVVWLLGKPLVERGEREHLAFVGVSLALVALIFAVPAFPQGVGGALGLSGQVFGLFVVVAIVAVTAHLGNHDASKLLVVVWAGFITSAAFTQLRFNYYLAVVVAVMNAYLLAEMVDYLTPEATDAVRAIGEIETYQIITLAAVAMLVLAPALVVPLGLGPQGSRQTQTAWNVTDNRVPGAITQWNDTLGYMRTETPAQGNLGGAGNADRMEYFGSYPPQQDFDYPDGSYGVMAWWDYGHWITVRGERTPVANPFQENAGNAADFLLAPNETAAEDAVGTVSEDDASVRYVMIDWQMVNPNSKFTAPTVFNDRVSQSDFYGPVYASNFRNVFNLRTQQYYESMVVRLYAYHGSAMTPQPIVVDWQNRRVQTQDGRQITVRAGAEGRNTVLRQFDNVSAAQSFVESDGSAQVGGVGHYPTERVSALEHYRLVTVSESSALRSARYQQSARRAFRMTGVPPRAQTINQPSWVKVFERVPGATITADDLAPNTSVRATVEMRVPATNETFAYRQETRTTDQGELSMTLPYATTGYDEYGPENGYTNASVRATGPYVIESSLAAENGSLVQYRSTVEIQEGRVNGDIEGAREVSLERTNPLQNLSVGDTTAGAGDDIDRAVDGSADEDDDGAGDSPTPVRTAAVDAPDIDAVHAPVRD
jgi:oligosaccharyl transferase (archaeosortase A-associated)